MFLKGKGIKLSEIPTGKAITPNNIFPSFLMVNWVSNFFPQHAHSPNSLSTHETIVNSNLEKLKNTDETIKGLHRILFGRATTIKNPKANLKEFNGFADLTEVWTHP